MKFKTEKKIKNKNHWQAGGNIIYYYNSTS